MASPYISPRFAAIDSYGNPLVGGKLYTYANTTTTPQTTYQDAAETIANTNPIILDSRGEAVIFLQDGMIYTFVLKTAADALIWSQDGISGSSTGSGGVTVVNAIPTVNLGTPVYLPGSGIFSWNGTAYVSDFSNGFGGGGFSDKNRITNGGFLDWPNGSSVGPITSATTNPSTALAWKAVVGGSASITVARQSASSGYGQNRVGGYTARITSNAAATPGAADKNLFYQDISGSASIPLALGSLWGGYFTVSFWVMSSVAGTHSIAFQNSGSPSYRSYVTNFNILVAGAWEFKNVTVPIDQSGISNWDRTSSGVGLRVIFDLGSGANSEGAVDVWGSTDLTRSTGSVRLVSTSGSTLEVGNIQIELGAYPTPFNMGPPEERLFGVGQFFQDVSGSRSFGVTYTNTTERPIWVAVSVVANAGLANIQLLVGGGLVSAVYTPTDGSMNTFVLPVNAVIPPGVTYRCNVFNTTGIAWREYR